MADVQQLTPEEAAAMLTERGRASVMRAVERAGEYWNSSHFRKDRLDSALGQGISTLLGEQDRPAFTAKFAEWAQSIEIPVSEWAWQLVREADTYFPGFPGLRWASEYYRHPPEERKEMLEVKIAGEIEWLQGRIEETRAQINSALCDRIHNYVCENLGALEERCSIYPAEAQGYAREVINSLHTVSLNAAAEKRQALLMRLGEDEGRLASILEKAGAKSREGAAVAKALVERLLSESLMAAKADVIWRSLKQPLTEWLLSEGYLTEHSEDSYVRNGHRLCEQYRLEVAENGFDLAAVEGKRYRVGAGAGDEAVKPREMRQRCIEDYLDYCEQKADPGKEKQKRRVEFARRVFAHDPGLVIEEYLSCLSKPRKEQLEALLGKRKGKQATLTRLTKSSLPELLKGLFSRGEKQDVLAELEKAAYEELRLFLQSKGSDGRRESLETVIERFNPEVYESIFLKSALGLKGAVFEFDVTRDPSLVKRSAKATSGRWGGSCIARNGMDYFEKVTSDPGTLFLAARQDGRLKGYARLFLMMDKASQPVLAVDTLEPPCKDFEKHIGLVNAMALAAVQLGLDIGAKYVVAEDARIKYGPRQAFGNKQRNMHLTKLGSHNVTTYCFSFQDDKSPYVLMEGWR